MRTTYYFEMSRAFLLNQSINFFQKITLQYVWELLVGKKIMVKNRKKVENDGLVPQKHMRK